MIGFNILTKKIFLKEFFLFFIKKYSNDSKILYFTTYFIKFYILLLTFFKATTFLIEENARWFHKTKISFMPHLVCI